MGCKLSSDAIPQGLATVGKGGDMYHIEISPFPPNLWGAIYSPKDAAGEALGVGKTPIEALRNLVKELEKYGLGDEPSPPAKRA